MKRFVTTVWALLTGAALCHATGWAQTGPVSEQALKSALFFKLPQFVYRADDARDRPLVVCLLGGASFASPFEKLAQASIDGRPVLFARLTSVSDALRCDFVFISQTEAGPIDPLVKRLAAIPVVSVSDVPGFAKAGGMVKLALGTEGSPVSILINRKAARVHNIEFNAQLLRLAKVVEP